MKGVEQVRHDKESSLYQDQLEQYIHSYLQQGYSPQDLEHYLISKGYGEQSVQDALKSVNNKYYQNTLELRSKQTPMKQIFLAATILIVLSLSVYFYFQHSGSYEFSLQLEEPQIASSEPLVFVILTNKNVDANIQVTTTQGNFVLEKNEFFEKDAVYYLWLPENIRVGSYTVDFYITYKGEETHHSYSFFVEEKNTLYLSQTDLTQLNLALAQQDESLCQEISSLDYQDECYFSLATQEQDENYCSFIITPKTKDDCYFTLILNGKELSCSLIEDISVQDSCYGLND